MKKSRTLILGYGLNPDRTEAIAKSAIKLQRIHGKIGLACDIVSIDQIVGTESLIKCIVNHRKITERLIQLISNNHYTHIVDVFALPISSLVFTKPILAKFPGIVFIKEIQNDYGSSRHLTYETLIRIIGNNKIIFDYVRKAANICFSRNLNLCNKYSLHYLPTSIPTKPLMERRYKSTLSVCYLGHPLAKKGISIFPEIFKDSGFGNKSIKYSFAFSDIGPRDEVIKEFTVVAEENNIKINIEGKVDPATFFRKNDIYLLPIHDQFGAASTPNTVLEAMEAGCVVMTTPIESVQGVLNDQNSILLKTIDTSTIHEALVTCQKDIKTLLNKSKTGRRVIINKYSESNYILHLRKLYETKK
ncbi:glycosyltransferase [Candidatus Woesebacteria bacterium]|nr:glycosyltransferase [Candidatus Woesebacteria bacterium]